MEKSSPFTFLNAINDTKIDVLRKEDTDLREKDYKPFLTNRSLSYHADTIFYANDMNERSNLDHQLQFDYLINSVRRRKRFAKWAKPVQSDDLDAVMEFYGVSEKKALPILDILSKSDIAELKTLLDKGGYDGQSGYSRKSGGDST